LEIYPCKCQLWIGQLKQLSKFHIFCIQTQNLVVHLDDNKWEILVIVKRSFDYLLNSEWKTNLTNFLFFFCVLPNVKFRKFGLKLFKFWKFKINRCFRNHNNLAQIQSNNLPYFLTLHISMSKTHPEIASDEVYPENRKAMRSFMCHREKPLCDFCQFLNFLGEN